MEWQAIETCRPVHGTKILAFVPGINDWQRPDVLPNIVVAAFDRERWSGGAWVSDMADIEGYESTGSYIVHEPIHPTHWMPLPEPPSGT
jgi:hypothetical protein